MRNYKIFEINGDKFYFDDKDENKFIMHLNLTKRYHKYYLIGNNDFGIYLNFIRK